MTLLTIVQDAMALSGLPKPTIVAASTDPGAVAMLAMVNQSGKELMRRYEWEALTEEHTFPTVAAAEQVGSKPDDFDHIVNETIFNRTRNRPLYGPIGKREWQQRHASVTTGTGDFFRFRGGAMLISPTPSAADTIAYEYVSRNWVDGDKAAMTTDTDVPLLDDNIIMLGAVWRYLKSKGLDYAEDFRTAEEQTLQAMARDGGRGTQSLHGSVSGGSAPVVPRLYDGQLINNA